MAVAGDKEYDVFLVHSSDDKEAAIQIKTSLSSKRLRVYAHYDEGSKFDIGKPTVDSIMSAVNASRIVLILLTPNAIKSQWVSFEILLSLERSQREGSMCCRLCMVGISEDQRRDYQIGELKHIPSVIVDFNQPDWVDRLYASITATLSDEERRMEEILPSGNVAVGLVFNYFVGFLQYVLPNLKQAVEASDIYKANPGRVSQKLFMLLPSSCVAPSIVGGGEGGKPKVEKEGNVKIEAGHGDKKRQYNPTIYSVVVNGEKHYFVGECPTIIETMSKIKKHGFLEIDVHLQVERFRITLQELVQHRQNKICNDSVVFISYDDTKQSAQEVICENVIQDRTQPSPEELSQQLHRWVVKEERRERQEEFFASITNTDIPADQQEAHTIMEFLGTKGKKFTNGEPNRLVFEVLEKSRWNIFIFSRAALADKKFKAQFDAAITASINDDQIQVIPVLSEGMKIEEVPTHYKWVTVLSADEPNHVEKLWNVMSGPATKMTEKIPAGEVYKGLAWAYLLNYLPLALLGKTAEGREFEQRFEDGMKKYNVDCPCLAKVFIIIPASCTFPPPGSQFEGEEHIGALEPVVLGFRKFFLQLYRITMKNGQKYCYAREYATPVIAMHEMANTYPFAGLSKEALFKQTELFTQYLKDEMKTEKFKKEIGDLESRVRLVNYDDMKEVAGKRMTMVEALETEIQSCLVTDKPLHVSMDT